MNVARYIEESAERYPNKYALIFRSETYTFKELNEEVDRLAAGLNCLGLKKGDTLAILLPNTPLAIMLFYAGLKSGAVTVCLNPMLKGVELNKILIDSETTIFITQNDCIETVKNCQSKIIYDKNVILIDKTEDNHGEYSINDLICKGKNKIFKAIEIDSKEKAVIVYTSGTTGEPKGAVFTHDALMISAKSLKYVLGEMAIDDKILNSAPLSSSMSIVAVLIPSMISGACIYLQERFDPAEYVETIRKEKITIIYAVPTIYFAINKILNSKEEDMKSLRFIGCSGAPLPLKVRQEFESKFKKKIVQAYGMTEATRILIADPINGEKKEQSIGKPLPDVEIKIVDEKGGPLGIDEKGELCAYFPGGMIEYWKKPGETKKVLRNGWLHTGDIAKVDRDGYVYIVDRKTDKIIVGGFNVYPAEIENVLMYDSRVLEAAVVGYPDDRLGEIPVAFIVLKEGAIVNGDELIEFAKTKIAKYKAPRYIFIEKQIPKNPVGKMLKRILKEKIESDEKFKSKLID